MKYDVFISHSGADLEIAEQVYAYLQEQGISCWIDSRNVSGSYARSIIEGIKESEVMVLVFSKNVNTSMHVENEIDNAFCMGKTIIPFRIDPVPYSDVLRYYLNKAHYVDVVPDLQSALGELCLQVKRNLPEHQKSEQIDGALSILSKQTGIDIERLRALFEEYQRQRPGEDVSDEFLQSFIDGTEKGIYEDKKDEVITPSIDNGKEGSYNIFQNATGGILIITNIAFDSAPENPRFVYDGGDSMLFYRNRESSTVLGSIAPQARSALMKVDYILVAEMFNDNLIREYKVPLRKVAPVDEV